MGIIATIREIFATPAKPAPAPEVEEHFCSARKKNGEPCSRNGVVERGGKLYCRQHDPERQT